MNAADAFDIGSFDEEDTKGIKVKSRLTHPTLLPGLSARRPATSPYGRAAASKAPHARSDFLKWKGSLPGRGHVSAGEGIGVQGNLSLQRFTSGANYISDAGTNT